MKRVLLIVLLAVFVFSVGTLAVTLYQYRIGDEFYDQAASEYLTEGSAPDSGKEQTEDAAGETEQTPETEEAEKREPVLAPVVVDFASLREVNPDVTGWLYCEDTVINYPVLHGADDDMYLHHLYDGSYCYGGSLFVEAENLADFADYNTIIYGHNMRNGTMFGTLDEWADQEYYEAHPVFWLLTPERDYRVDILAGYTTSAYSDTYTIFGGEGPELDAYLNAGLEQSVIETGVAPEPGSRYVLFSTCAYVFDDARFVLHGKLVPLDSAGGLYRELPAEDAVKEERNP